MLDVNLIFRTAIALQALCVLLGIAGIVITLWRAKRLPGAEIVLTALSFVSFVTLIAPLFLHEGDSGVISFLWLAREGGWSGARHGFEYSSLAVLAWFVSVSLTAVWSFNQKKMEIKAGDLSGWKCVSYLGLLGLLFSSTTPWSGLVCLFFMSTLVFLEEREVVGFFKNQMALIFSVFLCAVAFFIGDLTHIEIHSPVSLAMIYFILLLVSGVQTAGAAVVTLPLGLWVLGLSLFILRVIDSKSIDRPEAAPIFVGVAIFLGLLVSLRSFFSKEGHSLVVPAIVSASFLAIAMRLLGVSNESVSLWVMSASFLSLFITAVQSSTARGKAETKSENWILYLLGFVVLGGSLALPGTAGFQIVAIFLNALSEEKESLFWVLGGASTFLLSVFSAVFFFELRKIKQHMSLARGQLLVLLPAILFVFVFVISGNLLGMPSTELFYSAHAKLIIGVENIEAGQWAVFYGMLALSSVLVTWLRTRQQAYFEASGKVQGAFRSQWVLNQGEALGLKIFSVLNTRKLLETPGFIDLTLNSATHLFHRFLLSAARLLGAAERLVHTALRRIEVIGTDVLPRAFQLTIRSSVSSEVVWVLGIVLLLVVHFALRMVHE